MIISRDDLRFWDVRIRERRIRSKQLSPKQLQQHLDALPDVADKATISVPLDEPDERANERLRSTPQIRVTLTAPPDQLDIDDDDIEDDDDDDDDIDDDEDEDDLK